MGPQRVETVAGVFDLLKLDERVILAGGNDDLVPTFLFKAHRESAPTRNESSMSCILVSSSMIAEMSNKTCHTLGTYKLFLTPSRSVRDCLPMRCM